MAKLTSLDLGGLSSDLAADIGLYEVLTLDIAGGSKDLPDTPSKLTAKSGSEGVQPKKISGASGEASSSLGSGASHSKSQEKGHAGNEATANIGTHTELQGILKAIVVDSAEGFTNAEGTFTSSSVNPIIDVDEATGIVHGSLEMHKKKDDGMPAPATPPAGLKAIPASNLRQLARMSRYFNIRPLLATSPAPEPVREVSTLAKTSTAAVKRKLNMEPQRTKSQPDGLQRRRGSAYKMKLALRKDTPVIRTTRRGSMAAALAAGAPDKRAETMAKLKEDEVAPSGRQPKKSRWTTWKRFHKNWLGEEPVLPLTPHSIAVVISQLKEGKYRSVGDYMSTAKNKHLESYEWTSRLARAHTVNVRSALRGIGPAKQCEEVGLEDLIRGANAVLGKPGIPIGINNTFVVLYFFVLREIELGTMLAASVRTDRVKKTVHIDLPATKTDPMALSCTRSWGCTCIAEDEGAGGEHCPYHAAVAQQELLDTTFGDRVSEDGFPFSPDANGEAVEKTIMIKAMRTSVQAAGIDIHTDDGEDKITGHLGRIGGCRYLLRRGVSVPSVMALARWESYTVLRYAKDAPLAGITGEFKRGLIKKKLDDKLEAELQASRIGDAALAKLKELEIESDRQQEEIQKVCRKIQEIEDEKHPRYIISDKYRKWHVVEKWEGIDRLDWKTKCGWRYGQFSSTVFERRSRLPDDLSKEEKCPRCLPAAARLRK